MYFIRCSLITWIISLLIIESVTCSGGINSTEISALHDFYLKAGGNYWQWQYPESTYGKVWNFSTTYIDPCNNWQGVKCNSTRARDSVNSNITSLKLRYLNMTGVLSGKISNLTSLTYFNIRGNKIGHKVDILCSLPWLETVIVEDNSFVGTIPACFFNSSYSTLAHVNFALNYFHGTIPEVTKEGVNNVNYYSVAANFMTGTLPSSLQYLKNVTEFAVFSNYFSGPIDLILNFSAIEILSLDYNKFSTTIPENIASLSKLQYIYFNNNHLRGTIPESTTKLSSLLYLGLYTNHLTGTLPEQWTNLSKLHRFAVDQNYLTSTVPNSLGSLKEIEEMSLYDNYFSGSLPRDFSQLSKLSIMQVQSNQLTGSPSVAFNRSMQKSLVVVNIGSNPFTGTFPSEIFGPTLRSVGIYQVCFEGSLSNEICLATGLRDLILDGLTSRCAKRIWPLFKDSPKVARAIPGSIPECIWHLKNLTTLHISGNSLTGTIPDQDSYNNLTYIDLSHNCMTGTIPNALQSRVALNVLSLQSNRFNGRIKHMKSLNYSYGESNDDESYLQPDEDDYYNDRSQDDDFENDGETHISLDTYIHLKLSTNRLSGPIPSTLEDAHNIDILSGNVFSCSVRHPVPNSDPNRQSYICGSEVLDLSLFTYFSGLVCITMFLLSIAIFMRVYYNDVESNRDVDSNNNNILLHGFAMVYSFISDAYHYIIDVYVFHTTFDLLEDYIESFNKRERSTISSQGTSESFTFVGKFKLTLRSMYLFFMKVLLWRSRFRKILEHKLVNNTNEDVENSNSKPDTPLNLPFNSVIYQLPKYPNLIQFIYSLDLLRYLIIGLMVSMVVINSPVYLALKPVYGTFYDQYRWYVSGIFLSGYQPALVLLGLWMYAITVIVVIIKIYIPRADQYEFKLEMIKTMSYLFVNHDNDQALPTKSVIPNVVTTEKESSLPQQQFEDRRVRHSSMRLMSFATDHSHAANTINEYDQETRGRKGSYCDDDDENGNSNKEATERRFNYDNDATHINDQQVDYFRSTFATMRQTSSIILQHDNHQLDSHQKDTNVPAKEDEELPQLPTQQSVDQQRQRSQTIAQLQINLRFNNAMSYSMKRSITAHVGMLTKQSAWISVAAWLINVIVVVFSKACFVYLINYYKMPVAYKIILGVVLSMTDVVWGSVVVPYFINLLPKKSSTGRMLLKLCVLYFNSIVAPCLAIVVTNDSCFSGLFVKADTSKEGFLVEFCLHYSDLSDECYEYSFFTVYELFTPTFVYNYNCYSAINTNYIPVFFFAFLVLSLFVPIMSSILIATKTRLKLIDFFPEVYDVKEPVEQVEDTTTNSDQMLSNVVSSADTKETVVADDCNIEEAQYEKKGKSTTNENQEQNNPITSIHQPQDQANEAPTKPKNKRIRLFFPGFILASILHSILIMITFGLIYPPLCVAACFSSLITTITWEIVVGRWILITEKKNSLMKRGSTDESSRNDNKSTVSSQQYHFYSQTTYSYNTEQNRSSDTTSSFKEPLDMLDKICHRVCCSPRESLKILAYGSSLFIGIIVVDMAGDELGWTNSLWGLGLSFIYSTVLLYVVEKRVIRRYYEQHQQDVNQLMCRFSEDNAMPFQHSMDQVGHEHGRFTTMNPINTRDDNASVDRCNADEVIGSEDGVQLTRPSSSTYSASNEKKEVVI